MAQRQLYSGLDLYDWRGTGPNGRTKAVDVDKWQQNQEDIRHLPGAFPVQSVVITDGQITPTAAALSVDTEGGAPADDLTAIAPGDLHAGMLLALCSVDTGRKVTIKNSAGASGIQTLDGKDVVLDTQYAVMLRLVSTESLPLWREEPGPLRLKLSVATPTTLGGVKVGAGLNMGDDGSLSAVTVPVGGIIAFSGTFGGDGNRFPIPLGGTSPDTNWCLCDGVTTNGRSVPDLRGRMIMGASDAHPAGSTGGSETHSHSLSGTVGATTLTVEQLASHTHGYRKVTSWNGWNGTNDGNDCKPPKDGQPTDATGSSQPHTHTLEGASGEAKILPPYYALSFVMRCA